MGYIIKQTRRDTIPAGQYLARIHTAEVNRTKEPRISITYEVVGGEYDGSHVAGRYRTDLYKGSPLYKVAEAVFKDKIGPVGWTFDLDELVGHEVLIDVSVRPGSDGPYSSVTGICSKEPTP